MLATPGGVAAGALRRLVDGREDVGGLFEIEYIDLSAIKRWMVGMTVTAAMLVVSVNGKVYQHSSGTITGSEALRQTQQTHLLAKSVWVSVSAGMAGRSPARSFPMA